MRALHVINIQDIDALTLGDIRALQCADRIYFQSDSNQKILQFARREATRIQVNGIKQIEGNIDLQYNSVFICKHGMSSV